MQAMAPSDWSTFPHADGWWSIQVPASARGSARLRSDCTDDACLQALEFVMTDGHGNWAKAGRRSASALLPAFLKM